MNISRRTLRLFVVTCCMGLALPAAAQTSQPLPTSPAPELQQQIEHLEAVVGDLQQRVSQAEAVAAASQPASQRGRNRFKSPEP